MKRLIAYLAGVAMTVGLAGCGDMLKDLTLPVDVPFSGISVRLVTAPGVTSIPASPLLVDPGSNRTFQDNKSKLKSAGLKAIKVTIDQINTGNSATSIDGATVTIEDATTHEKHTYKLASTIPITAGVTTNSSELQEDTSKLAAGQSAKTIGDFFSGILTSADPKFTLTVGGNIVNPPIDVNCSLTLDATLTVSGS
jgi:hypothetical protein